MSVIVSVQLLPGQSGAPGIGFGDGGLVVTLNATFPFFTADAGIDSLPVTVTGAGFCPGGLFAPEGLVHVAVGFAVADKITKMSVFPSPARLPEAVRVRPLSVNEGPLFM